MNGGPVPVLKLGTRRSPLALAQSRLISEALALRHGVLVELEAIETEGDRQRGDLAALGGKGLFTRELEERLQNGTLDLAVHSLKDLPVRLPEGLLVAAYPERADPRDVLVSTVAESVEDLPEGALVLSGSLRRRAQLLAARPDLAVEPLRGNVGTRLRKWRERGAAATVLAAAGIARLELADVPAHPLDAARFVPAPGQGILAIEVREGSPAEALCRLLDHGPTRRAALAERRLVDAFGGDCTLPLGAWARSESDGGLRLNAVLATPDGGRVARAEEAGADPESVADAVLVGLRRAGADEVLAALGRPVEPPPER